jgi:hypothetical protein
MPVGAMDAVSIHTQLLIALRYSPEFEMQSADARLGPIVEGAFGLDVAKTHADLASPEGLKRITTTEPLPTLELALGVHSLFREAIALDARVAGQILLSFDRGERGGGDDLRVLFGLLPGLELSGHF